MFYKCLNCGKPTYNLYCNKLCEINFTNLGVEKVWKMLYDIRDQWDYHYKEGNTTEVERLSEIEDVLHVTLIKKLGTDSELYREMVKQNELREATEIADCQSV